MTLEAEEVISPPEAASEHPLHPSNAVSLRRKAPVESINGGAGRLEHVIIHPVTREVTHLVVIHDGKPVLVPAAEVAAVRQGRVLLSGAWSRYQGNSFDRAGFHAVPAPAAREGSQRLALHDGSPLLDASPHEVRIVCPQGGSAAESTDDAVFLSSDDNLHHLVRREGQPYAPPEGEQAGMIRVSRRVVRRIETVEVTIREERAVFERLPGTGEGRVVVGDRELREGETLEVTLATERIHITKERVPLGDVAVRKETFQHLEPEDVSGRQDSARPLAASREQPESPKLATARGEWERR